MPTPTDEATDEAVRLERLAAAVAFYEAQKASLKCELGLKEHGDLVKAVVEPALSAYFADVLPAEMRIGGAFTVLADDAARCWHAQVDLVIDAASGCWAPTPVPTHHGKVPLYSAAMEARYGGAWMSASDLVGGVVEMATRLQSIVDTNVAAGRKCWTAALLLGPGYDVANYEPEDEILAKVLAALAALYEGRSLAPRALPGVPRSWPFVDAIVLPGVLVKKHSLFGTQSLDASEEHPAFFTQPCSSRDAHRALRPLAVAKGHLRHVLRCVADEKLFDSPAWDDAETPVFLGDYPDPDDMLRSARAITLDGARFPLFHAGNDPAQPIWQEFAADPFVGVPLLILGAWRQDAVALREREVAERAVSRTAHQK